MHITLKGDCEKIVCKSKEENIILHNGDRIEMENKNTISISSVATQKNEIWKCIYTFPLRVILAIFDILLMNSEWDWVEKFEPCTFIIENYLCSSCDNLEIKYNKSRFDKDSKKIIMPEITINDNKIESRVRTKFWTTIGLRKEPFYVFKRTKRYCTTDISSNRVCN